MSDLSEQLKGRTIVEVSTASSVATGPFLNLTFDDGLWLSVEVLDLGRDDPE